MHMNDASLTWFAAWRIRLQCILFAAQALDKENNTILEEQTLEK